VIDREAEDDVDFVVVDVDETKIFASADGAEGNGFGGFHQAGDVVNQARFEVEKLVTFADAVDAPVGIG
jgi:hypothetical protein